MIIRFIFILYFSFCFCLLHGQIKKFNNSAVKGKAITCPGYQEKYPCYNSTCKKIGNWIYYYKNGKIERIENYKKINDCDLNEIPDGLWQYFDEQGNLTKQEEFKDGQLWKADISEYYINNHVAGKILVRNGIRDTLVFINTNGTNLIRNGDFNLYYGSPEMQIGNGQKQIEKQIPYWHSPDHNTPDYYNQFRRLKNVPDNQNQAFNETHSYVGIILYHNPTGHYSEYITGELVSKLIPNKVYCLKIRMRLSQNSGFKVNSIASYLTDSIISPENTTENQKIISQISFNDSLDNTFDWKTLCASYTASGFEKYITIGRVTNSNQSNVRSIRPINQSEGEYNQSAYYIIDKVEFVEGNKTCCGNQTNEDTIERIDFDFENLQDSTNWKKTFVLNSIFFDFDKSELLPTSFVQLEKLLAFLKGNNFNISISGHTDNMGSDDYNLALSLSRAKSVSLWLIENGINEERIHIHGYGANLPIVENDSPENRAINRRVEFKIEK